MLLLQVAVNQRCARGGMADTPDLGSGAARREGSSPFVRTNLRFGSAKV